MTTLSLTVASKIEWPDRAAATNQPTQATRSAYVKSAINNQKTDGYCVITGPDAAAPCGWLRWTDTDSANEYITFIIDTMAEVGIVVTGSVIPSDEIPKTAYYVQF